MPEIESKIAKWKEENAQCEKESEALYTKIGKNYYEKPEGYQEGIAAAERRLDALKEQMEKNKKEILLLRGIRICPNCGNEVEKEAIFCGECGTRMEQVEKADENSIICSRCGMKNSKEKKFCAVCGQKLSEAILAETLEFAATAQTEEISTLTKASESAAAMQAETSVEASELATAAQMAEASALTEASESAIAMQAETSIDVSEFAATSQTESERTSVDASEPVFTMQAQERPANGGVIYCPECGSPMPAEALFCSECGQKIG